MIWRVASYKNTRFLLILIFQRLSLCVTKSNTSSHSFFAHRHPNIADHKSSPAADIPSTAHRSTPSCGHYRGVHHTSKKRPDRPNRLGLVGFSFGSVGVGFSFGSVGVGGAKWRKPTNPADFTLLTFISMFRWGKMVSAFKVVSRKTKTTQLFYFF